MALSMLCVLPNPNLCATGLDSRLGLSRSRESGLAGLLLLLFCCWSLALDADVSPGVPGVYARRKVRRRSSGLYLRDPHQSSQWAMDHKDLSRWNTGKVTNMRCMFREASSFNHGRYRPPRYSEFNGS